MTDRMSDEWFENTFNFGPPTDRGRIYRALFEEAKRAREMEEEWRREWNKVDNEAVQLTLKIDKLEKENKELKEKLGML